MSNLDALYTIAREFEENPSSVGIQLRLNLSELILKSLDDEGWSQKQLADAAGMKPAMVSRIIHSDSNCTFDVAGRLLFALGLTGKLIGIPKSECRSSIVNPDYIVFNAIGIAYEHGTETRSGSNPQDAGYENQGNRLWRTPNSRRFFIEDAVGG